MPTIVTVHGTSAGQEADEGGRWWQRSSPLLTRLCELLDIGNGKVEIVPFHWDVGPNSENNRRDAAKKLFEALRKLDDAGEEYYLVGHSHGGSVIYNALLHSAKKDKLLTGLRCWCTVGTPFMDFTPKKWFFLRLTPAALSVFIMGIFSIVMPIVLLIAYYFDSSFAKLVAATHGDNQFKAFYGPVTVLSLAYASLMMMVIFLYERYWYSGFSEKTKLKVREIYAPKWRGFWHKDDEAINGLRSVRDLHQPIVSRDFLSPAFSAIPGLFFVVGMIATLVFYEVQSGNETGHWRSMLQILIKDAYNFSAWSSPQLWVMLANLALLPLNILMMIFGISLAIRFCRWSGRFLLGRPAAVAIDKLVWTEVRRKVWGADLGAERVADITSHPPRFELTCRPLPERLSAHIDAYTNKHALESIGKARSILGLCNTGQLSSDLISEIGARLNWNELVHTSYFDVPEFVQLLAVVLKEAGLGTIATDDPDKVSSLEAWLWWQEITAGAPSSVPRAA